MTAAEKLSALRARMDERGLDAYLVVSADAHQSEYVSDYWRGRAWLSGFDGSAGKVAVIRDEAGLWTDGRYFIQAENQIKGSGITLYKMDVDGVPELNEWLKEKLPENGRLGFDGRTVSVFDFDGMKKDLSPKKIAFEYGADLLGEIWNDRPPLPTSPAFEHAAQFSGASRMEKLKAVREEMRKKGADYYLVASLDDIAWLLNIRGNDVPMTPVVYAYCLIGMDCAYLFVDSAKIGAALSRALAEENGYELRGYEATEPCLQEIKYGRLLYHDKNISVRLAEAVPEAVQVIRSAEIISGLKAVKNPVEIANIRNAHLKDGAAVVRMLKKLDEWAADPRRKLLTEGDVSDELLLLRSQQEHFLEPSFETIAAYGANAASMHYGPEGRGAEIKPEGFLLIDSGGQYLDGTTDITRTVVMGEISGEMKRDFTLVLKGHIALASAQFLSGITGRGLDTLARMPLWAQGINYRSGTGHGLGYCLSVHEGPQGISMRPNETKIAAGMLCTNEPGVYNEGRYGIRTENVLLAKELYKNEYGTFLCFETVSFCPIDKRAVDIGLLTREEVKWLNDYHKSVYDALSPLLDGEERDWLAKATAAL